MVCSLRLPLVPSSLSDIGLQGSSSRRQQRRIPGRLSQGVHIHYHSGGVVRGPPTFAVAIA